MLYDPRYPSVVSLNRFEGADAATSFTDDIGLAWTLTNCELDTSQARFGGSSLKFNGTAGAIAQALLPTNQLTLRSDFCIELSARFPTSGTDQGLFHVTDTSINGLNAYRDAATSKLFVNNGLAGTTTGTKVLAVDTWYDVCVLMRAGTVYVFIDRVLDYSYAVQGYPTKLTYLNFGNYSTGPTPGTYAPDCWIDNARFTQYPRWLGTPPVTESWPVEEPVTLNETYAQWERASDMYISDYEWADDTVTAYNSNNGAARGSVRKSGTDTFGIEFTVVDVGGTPGAGRLYAGFQNTAAVGVAPLANRFWWRSDGTYQMGGATGSGLGTYDSGDVLGFVWKNGNLWLSKNGVWSLGDPDTNTSPSFTGLLTTDDIYASVTTDNTSDNPIVRMNGGKTAYTYLSSAYKMGVDYTGLYSTAVEEAGAWLYHKMDEVSGQLASDGYEAKATESNTGTFTYNTPLIPEPGGVTHGVNSRWYNYISEFIVDGAMTFSLVGSFPSWAGSPYMVHIGDYTNGANRNIGIYIHQDTGNMWFGGWEQLLDGVGVDSGIPVVADEIALWHFVYRPSVYMLYKNGTLVSTVRNNYKYINNTTSSPIRIGALKGASDQNYVPSGTKMGHVALYNRPLSSSDILSLAAAAGVAGPEITVQPVGGSYNEGDPVSLSVTAVGQGVLSYQWFSTYDGIRVGATSATYNFTASWEDDGEGIYCEVTDDIGTSTTEHASMVVAYDGDKYWNEVTLLLHGEGADGGTVITDSSQLANTPSAVVGTPTTTTSNPAVGLASVLLGTGTQLEYTIPFNPGTGDFTVEYKVRVITSTNSYAQMTYSQEPGLGLLFGDSGYAYKFLIVGDQVYNINVTQGAMVGVWRSIVWQRKAGRVSIYYEGDKQLLSNAPGATYDIVDFAHAVDYDGTLLIGKDANMQFDEVRVTIGVARYTDNYVVATTPFPEYLPGGGAQNPVVTGPSSQMVNEFTDATFIVSATGDVPLTYQWYLAPATALAGETTDTLVITGAVVADDGNQYFCTVTDVNLLSTDSATATLSVVAAQAPVFTTQPEPVFPLDGETLSFFVAVTSVVNPTTYQWYEATAGILAGETADTLTLLFTSADAGKEYYCIATDASAKSTTSDYALVTIVTVPSITTDPQSASVIEFRDVTFTAVATGNGPFVYDWYNDVDGLIGADIGGTLTFASAAVDDQKMYWAEATDIYDHSTLTAAATLTVLPSETTDTPPFIDSDIVGPTAPIVPYGKSAVMTVSVLDNVAVAPVTVDWYNDVDGLLVADGGLEYTFIPTVADQGKNYFVVVTDSLGQVGQGAYALLTLAPAELTLSWSVANAKPDGTIIKYQSIAWSVFDAYSAAQDGSFTCPLRTHRGLDDEGRTYWIPFYDKSARCSRGPLTNDAYNRYYWTQDGEDARYAPLENLKLDTLTTGIVLGVPAPTGIPKLQAEVAVDANDLETRAYVYTYVSVYGEEGPPSEPIVVTGSADGRWHLTGMETGPVDGKKRRLTIKRIYRTITGATGATDYYRVASLPLTVTRFTDRKLNVDVVLNPTLESYNWFPPPEGLSGIIAHPNGFFVGHVGRDIYFSEPYRPHAWNPAYVVSTVPDVVGFGIFGSTVVVCTESYPYTLTGIHPGAMAFNQHDTPEPCVSRYGIVSMPFGVYFPGPNGLMLASPAGFQNATKELMTKEEWQNRYQVRELDAAQYQSQYVAFYSPTKGVMFAPDEQMAALVDLDLTGAAAEPDQMDTIFTDEYSGKTYLLDACNMYEWNPVSGAPLEFDWTSMEFDSSDPINFGAARIIWYSRYTPPTAEQTAEWREWNIERMAEAPLNPFNFHAINVVRQVDVPTYEAFPEIKQPFHWSPLVWVPVEGEPWPNTPYVIMELIANEKVVFTQEIGDTNIFRLPSGWKATRFKIRLRSNVPIQSCKMTETGKELSRI